MVHYEENLANPPLLDGAPDRTPIEGTFFDCIPSASGGALHGHIKTNITLPLGLMAQRPFSVSNSLRLPELALAKTVL